MATADGDDREEAFDPFERLGAAKERARSLRDVPRVLAVAMRLVARAAPGPLAIAVGAQVVAAVAIAAQLLAGRALLAAVIDDGGFDWSVSAAPATVLVVAIAMWALAGAVQAEITRLISEQVERAAFGELLDLSARLDLVAFESPTFFDRLRRAEMGGQVYSQQRVLGLVNAVGAAAGVVAVVVAIAALAPAVVPLALLAYVPAWFVTSRNSRAYHRFLMRLTEEDRRRFYLRSVMLGRAEAKELRSYQLAPFLRARYDALVDARVGELRRVIRARLVRTGLGSIAGAALMLAGFALIAGLYADDRISLAAAGATVAAFLQFTTRLRALSSGVGSVYEASLFVDDYASFVSMARSMAGPLSGSGGGARVLPPFASLAAEGVTFTYPDAARPALRDVSLRIGAGEVVALVGGNGSGKSTLAKVLAGLYRPDAGVVRWNDEDVDSFDRDSFRREVAIIFQDFARYLLTARENVMMGRVDRDVRDVRDGAVEDAARAAGIAGVLEGLPRGYDTVLGREFRGSVDLSGGEWQRVALARAFYRDALVVILDEPTSALDARAEAELFATMRSLFAGRGVLLISHRFSSVRTADRIYVLDEGRVIEEGTHESLVGAGGVYADLFTVQAAAYLR